MNKIFTLYKCSESNCKIEANQLFQFLKKGFIVSLILLISNSVLSQVSVTGALSGNGTFSSLTKSGGAFQSINAAVQTGANIIITITGNVLDENGANGLNGGIWQSIKITTTGNNTISGDVAGPLINFNGADNITIDGIATTGANTLSFENVSTTNTASTFQYIHDAMSNKILNCIIKGSSTNTSGGTIHFRGTAGTTGNDNNSIDHCNITMAGTNTPNFAIYSSGSPVAGKENDNNSISNCNISDYYSTTTTSYGIYIIAGNSAWVINGNRFFQSTTKIASANNIHGAIAVITNANAGFGINDNIIGYASAAAVGNYSISSLFDSRFIGIQIQTGVGSAVNNVQGNIIRSIDFSTNSTNGLGTGIFTAIALVSGSATIGSTSANIIGDEALNGAILISNNADAGLVNGIYSASTEQINISGNKIGGITAFAASGTGIHFNGITSIGGGSNLICNNNEVGGNSLNSIQIGVTGFTNAACTVKGIFISASLSNNAIGLNWVKNISNFSSSNALASTIRGIECSRGVSVVLSNKINAVRYDGKTVTGMGNIGILMSSTASSGTQTVSQNLITDLSVTTTATENVTVAGINIRDVVTATVTRNRIYGLTNKSTGTLGFVNGIWASFSANCSIANNMISLDNATNTNGIQIAGIFDNGATTAVSNYWYNSVVIGGAQGIVSANSVCFQKAGSNMVNLRNNIFVMKRTGAGNFYAIVNNNVGGTWSSNNNVIYATVAATTGAWGSPPAGNCTFSVWKTASGGDANSLNVLPVFANEAIADLSLNQNLNCSIAGKGVSIPSITDDYFGTTRINPTDIGAHEFATTFTTWIGNNSNWNDSTNWCGKVPSSLINVIIPASVPNYPIIISGVNAFANSIDINTSAFVTINESGKLAVSGNFVNSGTLINRGELLLVGNNLQSFPGNTGIVSYMNKLTINNTSGLNPAVIFDANFAISGVLNPIAGDIEVNNVIVTLRSTADSTSRVAMVTGTINYSGDGKFAVERYFPATRSWRLITAPLYGTKPILDNWQNGSNNDPGIGTLITGNPTANGLDASTDINASMKTYNSSTQSFDEVLNTVDTKLSNGTGLGADNIGYFLWVRGDRNTSTLIAPNSNTTTLKSIGLLQTGLQTFAAANVAGNFTLVGNPYASPINFNTVTRNNLVKRFYTWDPTINKVGGFVVVDNWDNAATYLKDISPSSQDVNIQSSQAFFVVTDDLAIPASIAINEANKTAVNNINLFRPTSGNEIFRSSLFTVSAGNVLKFADANVASFDDTYSKMVDLGDATKLTNIDENFGLITNNKVLAIERRPILTLTDTLFFDLTKTANGDYQFVFEPTLTNANNLMGVLEDLYLNTSTDVSLASTTTYNFNINTAAPASAAANRFRIVFKPIIITPVTYSSVKAWQQQKNIKVEWKVENELNILSYDVEKSVDGIRFSKINTTSAAAVNGGAYTYNCLDVNPVSGDNFYRIKNTGRGGVIEYSLIVKVNIESLKAGIRVYPNPVIGNKIGLQFNNKPAGLYSANLFDNSGQLVNKKEIRHFGGNALFIIGLEKSLPSGSYLLLIDSKSINPEVFKVVIVQ